MGNRHLIVIEHDNKIRRKLGGIVHGLKGHTAGQRPVSNDGDHLVVFLIQISGHCKSKPRRDGCGAVAGIKGICRALHTLRKAAHSTEFSQCIKAILSAGEYFVSVTLMSHIPDDLVPVKIKCQMQRHGQLHHAEIGCQMSTVNADPVN